MKQMGFGMKAYLGDWDDAYPMNRYPDKNHTNTASASGLDGWKRHLRVQFGSIQLTSGQLILAEYGERGFNPCGAAIGGTDGIGTPRLRFELNPGGTRIGRFGVDLNLAAAAETTKTCAGSGRGVAF